MIGRMLSVVAITSVSGLAGEFTLTLDDRELVAQGSSEDFNGFDFSSDDLLPDVPFQDWNMGAGGFGGTKSGSGSGSSSQDSSMSADALIADGSSSASANCDGNGYNLGFAYSRYGVEFDLAETTRLRVIAELQASGEARAWVRIDEAGGDRLYDEDASEGPRSIDEVIELPAGSYEFQLRCDASVFFDYVEGSGNASSSYDGSLTVEAGCNAADLAPIFGQLDLADLQAFVSGFIAGDPISDLAAPFGVLDLADVQLFIDEFVAGCP